MFVIRTIKKIIKVIDFYLDLAGRTIADLLGFKIGPSK